MPPENRSLDLRLLALVAAAAVVRFWAWSTVGLDHFDEGGYAMSSGSMAVGTFGTERYPLQHFLSPPFMFGLSGLVMSVTSISADVLIGLSALLGIGTVALVYVFVARWFDRDAALIAAGMVAFADYHVLYSRAGLTDVAFGFWFLTALVLFAESNRRDSWSWAIAAGAAAGVAWNTKYHGWLAVVVAGGAVLLDLLRQQPAERIKSVGRVVLGGAVAASLYLPWAMFVSAQEGGYTRLVQEHAMYLQPLRAPWQAWAQLESQLYLDGWLGRLAPGAFAFWIAATAGRSSRGERLGRAAVVLAIGALIGSTLTAGLAALAASVELIRSRAPGVQMALSFLAAFTLLTPLYTPYPRLVLPLFLAAAILGGVGISSWVGGSGVTTWPSWGRRAAVAMVLATTAVAVTLRNPLQSASTYRAKDGFEAAAARIAAEIPPGATVVVWGEPGVVFYLRGTHEEVHHVDDVRRSLELSRPGTPTYLVTSLYSTRIGGPGSLETFLSEHAPAHIASAPVRDVSDVRLLDDYRKPDAAAFLDGQDGSYDLHLYALNGS